MIPIHPQPCPGRPDQLRWITPVGVLPFTGVPAAVPEPVAALLAEGVLAGIRVETSAVVTTLSIGRTWALDGSRVRSALHAALDDPGGWVAGSAHDDTPDEPLRVATEALLNGTVGELALSHGGSIQLLAVRDGVVTVRMSGACHGCPAAQVTLRQRLEDQLRRRCPDVRMVVDAGLEPLGGRLDGRSGSCGTAGRGR